MKVKKFLTILCLLLALCMLSAVALADDDTDSDPAGISYEDPTRIHEIDGHTVTGYTIIHAATCTEKALIRFTCEQDPTHFHEAYLAMYPYGHDWDMENAKVIVEATCTVKEVKEVTCKVCKETKQITGKALGHIWSSEYPKGNWREEDIKKYKPLDYDLASAGNNEFAWGRVTKEPTCTTPGEAEDFCPRCGAVNTYVKPRIIEPTAHIFGRIVDVKPTCKDDGSFHIGCIYCGAHLEALKGATDGMGNALYTDYVTKYDPETDGTSCFDGIVLTVAETETYRKDGGFANWNVPVDEKTGTFTGHDWDAWVMESPATCFDPRHDMRGCKICGDKQEKDVGKPLAPKYQLTSYSRLGDCWTVEVRWTCVLCNSKGKTADSAPVHPAHFAVFENNKPYPTTCADCGDTLESFLGTAAPVGVAHVEAHVYKHSTAAEQAAYFAGHVDPKCDTKGYDAYFCIYEDKAVIASHDESKATHPVDKEYIKELGHIMSDWELRVAPGQGDNEFGYWIRECTRVYPATAKHDLAGKECPYTEERFSYYYPEEYCAEGHKWETVSETPATCTTAGSKTVTCSVCGQTKTEAIEALGHDYTKEVVAEATCKAEGKILYTCTRCGNLKAESIAKKDHTPVDVEAVAPTCETEGVAAGKKCAVCGDKLEGFEAIPADENAHVWETETLKAATCTEDGTDVLTCKVCGKVTKKTVKALGHKWDDGVVSKEATKDAAGDMTYTCTVCGETKVEEGVVEYVVTADPKYNVIDLAYDGQLLTGKVVHVEDTLESEELTVRVTFFLAGNYYMATIGEVEADGTFAVEGVGPIEYISVQANGNSSVNPTEVKVLGANDLEVK